MKPLLATAFAAAGSAAFTTAPAQLSTARPSTRLPGVVTAAPGGSFLQGADDCATPHTLIGSGDQFGVPFTTGTTGTTGQDEANCYSFGSTVVDNDVWFDWTATVTGDGRVNTCGLAAIDTKIAVYPLSGCPADDTSLACNEDACAGLQSTVVWTATAGTTYTIQLGTFPGAVGGSGVFDVQVTSPGPCGQYDGGVSTNAVGFVVGGELGWIHYFECLDTVDQVSTAYGSAAFPGSATNGRNSRIAVYDDVDTIPGNGNEVLLRSIATVVTNASTDILNPVAVPTSNAAGNIAVLATADHSAGERPAPMDEPNASPKAWVVGSTLGPGTMHLDDLSMNDFPPTQMLTLGLPTAWLLRAEGAGTGPGTGLCFGDGSGAACGCGNESAGHTGCINGLGVGAVLSGSGTADTTADTVVLEATGVRAKPGLFFQGNNVIGGGAGATFGDGLRCCGQNVARLAVVTPQAPEPATATLPVTISDQGPPGTLHPGDTKCYQYWYRDPGFSPCGASYNLSSAYQIHWL